MRQKMLFFKTNGNMIEGDLAKLNPHEGRDLASIPDIYVEQAKKEGKGIIIRFDGKVMTLQNKDLYKFYYTYRNRYKTASGVEYGIIHAVWSPDDLGK